jgi:hypothetical protein
MFKKEFLMVTEHLLKTATMTNHMAVINQATMDTGTIIVMVDPKRI